MKTLFSLAHLTALGSPPPDLIYIAAEAGYDFVSPRLIMTGTQNESGFSYDLSRNSALLRQTEQALAQTVLPIHDIELARVTDDLDPTALIPTFEIAARLGVQNVLSSVWTANRDVAIERFAELCDVADSFGMKVVLEFVTWANVADLRQALDVVQSAKRLNARLVVDLLHAHRSHVTPDELAAVPSDLFSFVHLCDAPSTIPTDSEGLIHTGRAERLYVGEGRIDILGYLNALPNVPYSIEIPNLARVEQIGERAHAFACLQTAKAF